MSGTEGTECLTGVGRIVWGSPSKAQKKLQQEGPNKGQPVLKDGQPVMQVSFGLAIPKEAHLRAINAGNPNIEQIVREQAFEYTVWPYMAAEAAKGYANVPPRFSWKYKDGDGVDPAGQLYSLREGHAGHFILAISTELTPPTIFQRSGSGYVQLPGDALKCGDYVAVGLVFKVNVATGTNTPSLYVNPTAIEFVGYGTEIINKGVADPQAIFGGRQHALPPGASATPLQVPGGAGMPGMSAPPPQMQPGPAMAPQMVPAPAQQMYAPQPQPQPVYAPQPQPGMMAPPAADFVANAGYPQPAPAQQMYAPQPQPQPVYAPQPQPVQQYAPQPQPGMMPGMPGMPAPR